MLERIKNEHFRGQVEKDYIHYRFVKGKGANNAMFIIRQLQVKSLEGNSETYSTVRLWTLNRQMVEAQVKQYSGD